MKHYDLWKFQKTTSAHKDYQLLHAVIFYTHIHELNFIELIGELKKFNTPQALHEGLANGIISTSDYLGFTKSLINYMSSAFSLRDSSRNITKNNSIFSKKLNDECALKIQSSIKTCSEIKFIEDLRNIVTHQSLLIPTLGFSFRNSAYRSGYFLRKAELLSMERLSPTSRHFINNFDSNSVYLAPIIERYHSTTSEFQDWIICNALSQHKINHPHYWAIRNDMADEWNGDLEPRNNYFNESR